MHDGRKTARTMADTLEARYLKCITRRGSRGEWLAPTLAAAS
jgi:hypothetical protein